MSISGSPAPPSRPNALLHLAQARRNYRLYQELKQGGEHLDWGSAWFHETVPASEAALLSRGPTPLPLGMVDVEAVAGMLAIVVERAPKRL